MFQDAGLDSEFIFENPQSALSAYLNASDETFKKWQINSADFTEDAYKKIHSFWNSLF